MRMRSWKRFFFPRDVADIGHVEGAIARASAEQELVRVRSETPYYERLGHELRTLRERNHFADSIRATLGRT